MFSRPFAARGLEGGTARVHGLHLPCAASGVQGEAAGVGEDVEDPAGGVPPRSEVVLALVEEAACLLPAPQVRLVAHGTLADDDRLGNLAREHPHPGV
jgi:hypothetical protein